MINLTIKNFSDASDLQKYFKEYGAGETYSYEGFKALYDLFEDCPPDTIIDVVEICGQFDEFPTIQDAVHDLGFENEMDMRDNCLVIESYGIVLVGQ